MPTSVVFSAIMASSWTAAAGFAFSMSTFVTSMIISGLSMALQKKPEQQQAASIADPGRNVTTQSPIAPWRIIVGQTRAPGIVTYKKMTDGNTHFHQVITLAGHVCESLDEIWMGDEVVPLDVDGNATGRYAGYVRVKTSLGDEAGQPFPDLVGESLGEWTDAHRQSGCAKIYIRCTGNGNLFPTGLPNITVVAHGLQCFDPRSGLTEWTDNPAIIINAYLTDPVFGLGADYAEEINEADLIAAANICDELVTLADGSTEKRYTCNGAFLVSEKPIDIIGKLASSMAGYVVQVGAQWNIIAGAYDTPTLEVDEDDLAGQIQWTALVSRREGCNAVKGVYVAPENNYQATDFPPVSSDTYLELDGGNRVYHDLELNFTDSGTMAQRLAKIELLRTRQGLSVNFPGKLTCFRAQPGKTILLTIAKYGWANKPFLVANGTFAITQDGRLGYNLQLRETATAVYDWATDEESAVDFAPNTDLGDPRVVGIPGNLHVTESKYQTTGSAGVKVRATVAWDAPDDANVRRYELEYRAQGATDWLKVLDIRGTLVNLEDVTPGYYELRARSLNTLGVESDYTPILTKEILGLSDIPAEVTGLSITALSGMAYCTLDLSPDLDVRIGGRVVIRHCPLSTGATWEQGCILREFNGDAVHGQVDLITGTYFAKFVDSSGNYSETAASFVATEALVTGWTTQATITQHTAFAGAKTDLVAVDGILKLASEEMFDSSDMFDSDESFDGASVLSGEYEFDATLDLGSKAPRRLHVNLQASSFDTSDLFDSDELFDSPELLESDPAINDCDVTVFAKVSDDNITYGQWTPCMVADFDFRYAKFKARLESGSNTHNIAVSQLSVAAKVAV